MMWVIVTMVPAQSSRIISKSPEGAISRLVRLISHLGPTSLVPTNCRGALNLRRH